MVRVEKTHTDIHTNYNIDDYNPLKGGIFNKLFPLVHSMFLFIDISSCSLNVCIFRHSPENPDLLTTLGLLYMQVRVTHTVTTGVAKLGRRDRAQIATKWTNLGLYKISFLKLTEN